MCKENVIAPVASRCLTGGDTPIGSKYQFVFATGFSDQCVSVIPQSDVFMDAIVYAKHEIRQN